MPENGSVTDVIVQQAWPTKTAPIYHALTRPTVAEAEAVQRAEVRWRRSRRARILWFHLSSEDALNEVREARDMPAFAETCPQYLLLARRDDEPQLLRGREVWVFTPPLREKNQPKLWDE